MQSQSSFMHSIYKCFHHHSSPQSDISPPPSSFCRLSLISAPLVLVPIIFVLGYMSNTTCEAMLPIKVSIDRTLEGGTIVITRFEGLQM